MDELDVVGRAHERQRDQVDAEVQREPQVLGVLFGQCRHAHRDIGQRHTLVVGDRTALGHEAGDVPAVGGHHLDGDLAVVDQQPVAGVDLLGKPLVRTRHPVVRPLDVVAGDDDGLAVGPLHRAGREPAEADLGSLQIGQDPDRPLHRGRRLPYPVVSLLVLGVVTMAEVEPGHIHAQRRRAHGYGPDRPRRGRGCTQSSRDDSRFQP